MQKTVNINFVELFNAANAAYIKRNNKPNLNKDGMNPDIAEGLKFAQELTANQLQQLRTLGVKWDEVAQGIANASNIKKAKRIPQFLGFIASGGNANYLKGSAQTAMLGFCSLMIGAKNKNGLHFVVTGKGNENTSDCVAIDKARKVQSVFGAVGITTAPTQLSVSFSKGGILPMLGLCEPMQRGEDTALPSIKDSKLSRALIALINSASDSTIELWAQQSKGKKGSK